jgi:RimJ/RimL family protein N-acetyltransferase
VWGQKIIEEIAPQILAELFISEDLLRVSGRTPSHYRPGLAIAERLGFQLEGTIPHAVNIDGRVCDITLTGMTREDYFGKYLSRANY